MQHPIDLAIKSFEVLHEPTINVCFKSANVDIMS